jgi:hypothetical protein
MIFCAVALGAVVFLQNLEINGNAASLKAQGLEVQQKNNTFLINLECVSGKSSSPGSATVTIPQDKITACVVANQTIGNYVIEANDSFLDEEMSGKPYSFKDVMSVVDACATSEDPSLTNSVKSENGKSFLFRCPDTTAKKPMEIVAYK